MDTKMPSDDQDKNRWLSRRREGWNSVVPGEALHFPFLSKTGRIHQGADPLNRVTTLYYQFPCQKK